MIMTYELDDTDVKILQQLEINGRKPNVEIGRTLGIAESTVRKRIDRMQQAGVFRTVIVPDFSVLGLDGHMLIGLHVELGKAPEIASRLGDLEEVRFVAMTTGAFDIIMEIFLPSVSDFLWFIQDELAHIPGIKGIDTSTVLGQPKSAYNWTEMLRRGKEKRRKPQAKEAAVAM
jgi:Lrp/AsnC family transcriptional regulator for asnA, asnC and gidA